MYVHSVRAPCCITSQTAKRLLLMRQLPRFQCATPAVPQLLHALFLVLWTQKAGRKHQSVVLKLQRISHSAHAFILH